MTKSSNFKQSHLTVRVGPFCGKNDDYSVIKIVANLFSNDLIYRSSLIVEGLEMLNIKEVIQIIGCKKKKKSMGTCVVSHSLTLSQSTIASYYYCMSTCNYNASFYSNQQCFTAVRFISFQLEPHECEYTSVQMLASSGCSAFLHLSLNSLTRTVQ